MKDLKLKSSIVKVETIGSYSEFEVSIENVDTDDILEHFTVEEVVSHFDISDILDEIGVEKVLDEIGVERVMEYFNLIEKENG